MELIIGIDAGGTTTTGMVLNRDKDILYETQGGMGNLTVNFNEAATTITQVVLDCLAATHGSQCKLIVAGVAGIEAGDNKVRLEKALKEKTNLPIILINDALLAFYSIFGLGDGVLMIAGTGSISVGVKERTTKYTGGWGHLLGDSGSSYDVAIEACKQIVDEIESESHLKPLSNHLMEHLKITDASGLKRFIYNSNKNEIALISPFIYTRALAGDYSAQTLFENAGNNLAVQMIKLIRKLGSKTCPLIACKGSLLEKNNFVFDAFKTYVHYFYPTADIRIFKTSPTIGAVVIAENNESKRIG